MKKALLFTITLYLGIWVLACTKEVPKDMMNNQQKGPQNQQQTQQMPDDDIHRNLEKNKSADTSGTKGDPMADQMMKEADDAEAQYQKTKSEADKKLCIEKQLAAANYLMFDANLSPKKKYRPALQRYRRVLELDPKNQAAMENKKQIEDIYQSMGMPVPN